MHTSSFEYLWLHVKHLKLTWTSISVLIAGSLKWYLLSPIQGEKLENWFPPTLSLCFLFCFWWPLFRWTSHSKLTKDIFWFYNYTHNTYLDLVLPIQHWCRNAMWLPIIPQSTHPQFSAETLYNGSTFMTGTRVLWPLMLTQLLQKLL